jgi:hypothetical protein
VTSDWLLSPIADAARPPAAFPDGTPPAVGGDSFRNYLLALTQSLQSVNTNNAFAQLSPALSAEVFASYAFDELS